MGEPRTDKVLHDFKLVIKHQMILLRNATGAQTVYFYWVNRNRQQFVLESRSTQYTSVMFQDRISFDQHFLDSYKDIEEVKRIKVGDKHPLDSAELTHYSGSPPIGEVTLIPLQNNGETVAVTVVEHENEQDEASLFSILESYVAGFENMMETYMEINHLNQDQKQWEQYEEVLTNFQSNRRNESPLDILEELTNQLTGYMSDGGVILMGREGDEWVSLWNSTTSMQENRVVPGLKMEDGSIADECNKKAEVVYLSHLNGSPKRISSREPDHHGATLAVPVMVNNGMQAMILIYDQNPLVFDEAVKHKVINFIRLASQMITFNWNQHKVYSLFGLDEQRIYKAEVCQRIVERYLESSPRNELKMGIGRLELDNLHELRTKLRLEQLNDLEGKIIEQSRPVNMELPGFLGKISEFTYAVILPITQDETISYYEQRIMERNTGKIEFNENESVHADFDLNFTTVSDGNVAFDLNRTIESLAS